MPARHCPFSSEHSVSLAIEEFYFLQQSEEGGDHFSDDFGLVVAAGISGVGDDLPRHCAGRSIIATALSILRATRDMNTFHEVVDQHFTQAARNTRYVSDCNHACTHVNTLWIIFLLPGSHLFPNINHILQ